MNNGRIVLKSKSGFLSIPANAIISIVYNGGIGLEITYQLKAELSPSFLGKTKAVVFWFEPFNGKVEASAYVNLCSEIQNASEKKLDYRFEEE